MPRFEANWFSWGVDFFLVVCDIGVVVLVLLRLFSFQFTSLFSCVGAK
jgi:hypothetical protein